MKLLVNDTEFTPVGFGAARSDSGAGVDTLILQFCSEKQPKEIRDFFKSLPDSTIIQTSNTDEENGTLGEAFTDYVSLDNIQLNVNADDSYNYTVYLKKKSAMDIAKQAAANVEYIAVLTGIELDV